MLEFGASGIWRLRLQVLKMRVKCRNPIKKPWAFFGGSFKGVLQKTLKGYYTGSIRIRVL